MEALLVLITGALCIASFIIGATFGHPSSREEENELPIVTAPKPDLEAVREQQSSEEANLEQSRIDAIMRNIENYDGTGNGQEDIPRG